VLSKEGEYFPTRVAKNRHELGAEESSGADDRGPFVLRARYKLCVRDGIHPLFVS